MQVLPTALRSVSTDQTCFCEGFSFGICQEYAVIPPRALYTRVMRRQFVINIMSEWYVEAANHTCGDYDTGVDEMCLTGLTPEPSVRVGTSNKHAFV
jgi:hypothetical protein